MKNKVIGLAIVPTFALVGCDDGSSQRTKVNPPQRTYVQQSATTKVVYHQKPDGSYYKCANGAVVSEHQSCSSGAAASSGRHQEADNDTVKRGGFGSRSAKSGG